jgi:hypothetical protein
MKEPFASNGSRRRLVQQLRYSQSDWTSFWGLHKRKACGVIWTITHRSPPTGTTGREEYLERVWSIGTATLLGAHRLLSLAKINRTGLGSSLRLAQQESQ